MKRRLMDLLACPWCGDAFELQVFGADAQPDEVSEGLLLSRCGRTYPVVAGIPRILEDAFVMFPEFTERYADSLPLLPYVPQARTDRDEVIRKTRDSFGYQWTFFSEMAIDFRANFFEYIYPLDETFFRGKVGLDVGCGFGRHVYNAASFGAEMVAVDISDAIESARHNTRHLPNVHPVQADVYHLPFRPGAFDFAYSIGVLHHLPDPEGGYQGMVPLVKAKGAVFVWVYSKSRRFVNVALERARAATTRFPKGLQQVLSLVSALIDWFGFILPYKVASSLPLVGRWVDRVAFPRLKVYSSYPFQVVWADWFDRLAAPVRFYYNDNDLTGWVTRAGLVHPRISPTGLFGWRAYGERPEQIPALRDRSVAADVAVPIARQPRREWNGRPVRILAVATNPEMGASTRFRVLQWRPLLKHNGFDLSLDAFFSSAAAEVLYKPGRNLSKSAYFASGAIRRYLHLSRASRDADILLIHRESFPLGRKLFFDRIAKFPGAIVYDYDDAMFLPQRQSRGLLSRLEQLDTAKEIMEVSDVVLAGNQYLADYARQYTDRVVLLPTCIDTARFRPGFRQMPPNGQLTVGWIGSHSTAKYLHSLKPVLEAVAARHPFRLYVVGSPEPMHVANEEHAPWTLTREVDDFRSCDIGIYPLWDDAWAQGKCGFKAVQFMACGVPIVASAVGMNREIIQHGVNGFLAASPADWIEKLQQLLSDPDVRARMGATGRQTVIDRYSIAANGPRLVDALNSAQAHARSHGRVGAEPCSAAESGLQVGLRS